ncbi:hypothetical protein Tco_0974259 [Tanacetum coccineum]|uniref:DUF4216 domain-containing protein n=1 Tax=Tanacetum coccineum TaxID=301880 RepID=A0ABQ5EC25_9ASTR
MSEFNELYDVKRVFPEKVTETGVKKIKSCELLALVRDNKGCQVYLILMRTVNVVALHRDHHLAEKKKNPNFNATYNLYGFNSSVDLYSTPAEKREAWFVASIPFIIGLVDEDRNGCGDHSVGVSKDNVVDRQHEYDYEDESVNETFLDEDGYEDKRVNEKSVENNDQHLLENGDGVLDSEGGGINNEAGNVNQPSNVSIADLFVEVRALRNEVALIQQKRQPNIIPNESNDIAKCSVPDVTSNHTGVDQGLGGSASDPMSTCSRHDMHNAEVACDGMPIDKPDGTNDYSCSQCIPITLDVLIEACACSNKHPELDVLQHDNHVDHSADDFADEYMSVLNDEEMMPNYSLDDMKFQHEEDNLTVKERPPEYVNVVRDDYKPPLETIFGYVKSKKKKSGIRKNYVLRSVKGRKKKLALALDSP